MKVVFFFNVENKAWRKETVVFNVLISLFKFLFKKICVITTEANYNLQKKKKRKVYFYKNAVLELFQLQLVTLFYGVFHLMTFKPTLNPKTIIL